MSGRPFQTMMLVAAITLVAGIAGAQTSVEDPRLREGLRRYPEADGDGVLTRSEARGFLAKKKMTVAQALRRPRLQPEVRELAYGSHERCRLDLYLPEEAATHAVPVVMLIHGGGFKNGDKKEWSGNAVTRELVAAGFACGAINYPFLDTMPIQDILRQCARGVQFLRSHAQRWNLDPQRIAGLGSSAGAGTALWLATRDDLADPAARDPVLRQSSRLSCAVCNATQATYDFPRWRSYLGDFSEIIRDADAEAAKAYHLPSVEALATDRGLAIRRECDMLDWISPDDPPLYVNNPQLDEKPRSRSAVVHSIHHARAVRAQCIADGIECIVLQDMPEPRPHVVDFLIRHLGQPEPEK